MAPLVPWSHGCYELELQPEASGTSSVRCTLGAIADGQWYWGSTLKAKGKVYISDVRNR